MDSVAFQRRSFGELATFRSDSLDSYICESRIQRKLGSLKSLHSVQSLPNIWTRFSSSFSSDIGIDNNLSCLPEVESTLALNELTELKERSSSVCDENFCGSMETSAEQNPLMETDNLNANNVIMRHSRRKSSKSSAFNSPKSSPKSSPKVQPKSNTKHRHSFPSVDEVKTITLVFTNVNVENTEIITVQEGTNVGEAVQDAVERRGLSLLNIELNLSLSATPVPLTADISTVYGRRILLKVKQEDVDFHLIPAPEDFKDQFNVNDSNDKRSKKLDDDNELVSDVVDGQFSTWPANDQKSRALKAFNFLNPFVREEKLDELLNVYLNNYATVSLPSSSCYFTSGRPKLDPAKIELDKHWTQIVTNSQKMSKRECEQQEAMWELLETEVKYIRNVAIIITLFMSCLGDLQKNNFLTEIDLKAIFTNICDILNVNCMFWKTFMSKVVEHSKRTGDKLNPSLLKDAFLKFDTLFEPYITFCSEQAACLQYIHNRLEDNELFRIFVSWAESQPQCNRLKLPDLIIMPMQRITKYRLLLQAVLKKTDAVDQKNDLGDMLQNVEQFVSELNATLQVKEESDKLKSVIERIESYEAVDPINDECSQLIGELCHFNLALPIPGCSPDLKRNLLFEGPLKLKDGSSKSDVQCFLFTDLLLITKPSRRGDKVKVTKPPMRLDTVVVWSLRDNGGLLIVHVSDYGVATSTYLLTGDTTQWLDNIRKAQETYRNLRQAYEFSEDSLECNYNYDIDRVNKRNRRKCKNIEKRNGNGKKQLQTQMPSDEENNNINDSPKDLAVEATHNDKIKSTQSCVEFSCELAMTEDGVSDNYVLDNESLYAKLNQRRSSRTEKRYLTADVINDILKDTKTSGIHKRFSLNNSSEPSIRNRTEQLRISTNHIVSQVSQERTNCSSESVNSSQLSSSGVSSLSFHVPSENEDDVNTVNYPNKHREKYFQTFQDYDERSLTFDADTYFVEHEIPNPLDKFR